jgi:hypothetical protein
MFPKLLLQSLFNFVNCVVIYYITKYVFTIWLLNTILYNQEASAKPQSTGAIPKVQTRPGAVGMHGDLLRVCNTRVCFLSLYSQIITIQAGGNVPALKFVNNSKSLLRG